MLNVGHGGRGIGTTMSRSISNSQASLSDPSLLQGSSCRTVIAGFDDELGSRQSAYFDFTVVDPPRITGHGGIGIGTSMSILRSNSQLFVLVTVNVPPALLLLLLDSHLFCCVVVTVTLPVISGHGTGVGGGGGIGGSQSYIGGGVGGISQSRTKSKSKHSTNGTSHLTNSAAPDEQYDWKEGAAMHHQNLLTAVLLYNVRRNVNFNRIVFVRHYLNSWSGGNCDIRSADTVYRRN